MIQLLSRYWPAIWQFVSPVLCYMLATGFANLLTYLATDAAWLARHQRWAGAFKVLRGLGLSPQAVALGVQVIAGSRLPNSLQPLVGREIPQAQDIQSP